jgi:hypothetical protein
MRSVDYSVEWELGVETEVVEENFPQCYCVHHKSHMTWPALEPGMPRWETGDYPPELRHGPWFAFVRIWTKIPQIVSDIKYEKGTQSPKIYLVSLV